ncbi:hypothetical protein BH10BAC1_BH10BAC1_11170 [soil metagenome]
MGKRLYLLVCLLMYSTFSCAQKNTIDSLRIELINAKHDSTRSDIYLNWGEMLYYEFPDSAISLWQKAAALSDKHIASNEAEKKLYILQSARALGNIGTVYHRQGKIPKALEFLYKSLRLCEEINDKAAISFNLNNIGAIYFQQEDFPKALDCYEKSLKINKELNDKRWIGNLLTNIASIYDQQGNQAKALEYLHEGLKNYEEIGHKRGIASSLNNIAGIYKEQNNITKALEYYNRSLEIREALSDKEGLAGVLNNIADLKFKDGELNEALIYVNRGMLVSKEIGYPSVIGRSANILKRIFQKQNKYKEAFEMFELEVKMKDSLRNEETQKATLTKQLQYDYEKKEAVAFAEHKSELKNQEIIATEKNRKQKLITTFVIIGLLLVLLFAGLIFRSLRITRKQKRLIELQKSIVEEHQKEIIDSIHYARRIQTSLLPTEKYIEKNINRLKNE